MRPGQLALSLARLLYSKPQSQPHVHRLLVNVMEKTRSSIQTYMYSDLKADLLCLITDREMHCTASLSPALRLAPALLVGRKYSSQRRLASFAEGERSYNNAESAQNGRWDTRRGSEGV